MLPLLPLPRLSAVRYNRLPSRHSRAGSVAKRGRHVPEHRRLVGGVSARLGVSVAVKASSQALISCRNPASSSDVCVPFHQLCCGCRYIGCRLHTERPRWLSSAEWQQATVVALRRCGCECVCCRLHTERHAILQSPSAACNSWVGQCLSQKHFFQQQRRFFPRLESRHLSAAKPFFKRSIHSSKAAPTHTKQPPGPAQSVQTKTASILRQYICTSGSRAKPCSRRRLRTAAAMTQ